MLNAAIIVRPAFGPVSDKEHLRTGTAGDCGDLIEVCRVGEGVFVDDDERSAAEVGLATSGEIGRREAPGQGLARCFGPEFQRRQVERLVPTSVATAAPTSARRSAEMASSLRWRGPCCGIFADNLARSGAPRVG